MATTCTRASTPTAGSPPPRSKLPSAKKASRRASFDRSTSPSTDTLRDTRRGDPATLARRFVARAKPSVSWLSPRRRRRVAAADFLQRREELEGHRRRERRAVVWRGGGDARRRDALVA